jgi:hypothetical protein
MRSGSRLVAVVVALLPACSLLTDLGSLQSANSDAAVTPDAAPSGDGPVTCSSPEIDCLGTCADTAKSQKNCGVCGHDCGGGQCVDGVCQPFVIRDDLDGPVHMAVNDTGVFFVQQPDPLFQILECPTTGCTQAPAVVGAAINYIYDLAAGPGTILFLSSNQTTKDRPTLFYCPDTGCPASILTNSVDTDGLGTLYLLTYEGTHAYWMNQNAHALRHAECTAGSCSTMESTYVFPSGGARLVTTDSTSVFFVDGANALSRCPGTGTGCTPTSMATGIGSIAMSQTNALLYFLNAGASGYQNGNIESCNTLDCDSGTPLTVISNLAYPQLFAQDGTSAFWYAADTGVLQSAALQNTGTPAALVKNVGSVSFEQLRTHGNFVYWVQSSPTIDAANKKAIMAIAK